MIVCRSGHREQRRHGHTPVHPVVRVPFRIAALAALRRRKEFPVQPLLHVVIAGDFGQVRPVRQ